MVTGLDILSMKLSVVITTEWLHLDATQTLQTRHVHNWTHYLPLKPVPLLDAFLNEQCVTVDLVVQAGRNP